MARAVALGILLLLLQVRVARADATVTLCASDNQSGAGVNLSGALAVGGHITFNCGGHVTIKMNCTHALSRDTDLDGGGNVSLQGNPVAPGCGGLASSYAMFTNESPSRLALRLARIHVIGARPVPDGGITALTGGNLARGNLDVKLSDVTITNSYLPILIEPGSVTVERSEFTNNERQVIVAPAIAILDHSRFVGNGSSPIEVRGGEVTIVGSEFTANQQVSDLSRCSAVDIRNSQFTNNVGDFEGGALRTNCSARIVGSTFMNNRAKSGGAIHVGDLASRTVLIDVEFSNNVAASDGGAVAYPFEVLGPSHPSLALELHHVRFKGNRAGVGGALAFGRGDVTGSVLNPRLLTGAAVQFIDNQATSFAGGLFTSRAQVRLTRSLFSGNHAGTAGGGIVGLQSGDGAVELSNSILVKNFAPSGAAFAGNGVSFVNVTLADNDGPAVSVVASAGPLPIAKGPIAPQSIRFNNTIVSGGTANPCGPADSAGPYQDLGNNLQFPVASCAASIGVASPQFGPSYIPLPTSPAARGGSDAVCAAMPIAGRDLWDKPRPNGAHCSIGAAESDMQTIIEQTLAPVTERISNVLRCCCAQ